MPSLISIIIVSRNRQKQLLTCLTEISKSSYPYFEIIIVDQSSNNHYLNIKNRLKKISKNVSYYKMSKKGKSKGINFALKIARGDIIAFTDDDCLVDSHWLRNIARSFTKNENVVGVFGKTNAHQPEKHSAQICPCTYDKGKQSVIKKAGPHWDEIGFGNNMAYRKTVFTELGGFKEWLGPGSIGSNAEDAEFSLRVLINNKILLYNPSMLVNHNRWLSLEEYNKQRLSYICGELACYNYLSNKNHKFLIFMPLL